MKYDQDKNLKSKKKKLNLIAKGKNLKTKNYFCLFYQ